MLPGSDLRLSNAIQPILDFYEYVIIDTPPNAGPMLNNAIMASNYIVIPIEMSYQGTSGLGALHKTIQDVLIANRRSSPPRIGYLPTMFETRASDAKVVLDRIRSTYKDLVFAPVDRNRVIQKANAAHMDVFLFRPPRTWSDGIESSEKATKQYATFVEEVIKRSNSSK
jgi:chromosome partitioning protein